jgi:L-fuconolactonase
VAAALPSPARPDLDVLPSLDMRIDAHQHFWQLEHAGYGWIRPEWPIHRDYHPPDLTPLLEAHGIRGSVLVQARQTPDESDSLLELAVRYASILGVVGWVDLRADGVEGELARLAEHPKFVGVRHIAQDEPDDQFLSRPDFVRGVSLLARHDLTYDLLVFPRQLDSAISLARALPEQAFVLDLWLGRGGKARAAKARTGKFLSDSIPRPPAD